MYVIIHVSDNFLQAPTFPQFAERIERYGFWGTMVGSVRVGFDDALGTNTAVSSPRECRYPELPRIGRGEELGRFEFGSTLVVVASPGWIELDPLATGSPLRVGSRIGSVHSRGPASGQSGGTP